MPLPPGRFGYWPITERPKLEWPDGARVAFNKYKVRATTCLNLATLDHFPEVKDAMVAADWAYMAHGVYNTRPIYGYTVEEERAYWKDFIETVEQKTGKRVKGRLGGRGGCTGNTDDLMAEAGCLYVLGHDSRP